MRTDLRLPLFAHSIVDWKPPDDESVEPKPAWQTEDGEYHATIPAEPARPMCNERCLWFQLKEVELARARRDDDRGLAWLAEDRCMRPEYEQLSRHHIEICWPAFEAIWHRSFRQEASNVSQ